MLQKLPLGDLIGNKIADKIKQKNKDEEDENEIQELYISVEKHHQITDDLRLF